jgi:SWI/SNF related-matrix-associated actin-dependent regulator of chromatin subfamily C
VAAQARKVELKLALFEKLEDVLEDEKRKLELDRQKLFRDRISVQKQLAQVDELLARARAASTEVQPQEVQEVRQNVAPSTAELVTPVENPPLADAPASASADTSAPAADADAAAPAPAAEGAAPAAEGDAAAAEARAPDAEPKEQPVIATL